MSSPSSNQSAANAEHHFDVVILGAGAAGLMCAKTAAQRGKRVLLVETANKIGKKILMSGGGRCNFTNLYVEPENYVSANQHFCRGALSRYTQWDFLDLVNQYQIPYEERKHGQLFCVDSAKDILAMLATECSDAGVTIWPHSKPTAITYSEDATPNRYQLSILSDNKKQPASSGLSEISANAVVVATGALSIPSLGGSDFGYVIAQQFGLSLTERRAGLVPFMFTDSFKPVCERLSGTSVEVDVSCNKQSFREKLLFTHRGISGPVILQISNYWFPGDNITINLLPDIDASEWLLEAKQVHKSKQQLKRYLGQKLPKSLVSELETLLWPNHKTSAIIDLKDQLLIEVGQTINAWQLKPSSTEGYRTAEVTLGGVDTDGISSKTMEAKQQPGLYFIGEVLDVSGHLGGFNFQWAWASAYSAGIAV